MEKEIEDLLEKYFAPIRSDLEQIKKHLLEIKTNLILSDGILDSILGEEQKDFGSSLAEFKAKLKVGHTVYYDLIENDKRTGKLKYWTVTQEDINNYFKDLSNDEYNHHKFRIK